MNENLREDGNTRNVAGAVTDDSNAFTKMLRIDDATKGLKVMYVGGVGGGTITSITAGTGLTATATNPITTSGTIALDSKLAPLDTLGTALQNIRVNAGATALEYYTPTAIGLTIGTTTIASGTTTRILYDNAGILGEYTLTGTGTVVAMATSPTFQTSITGAYLTASEILITDASKNIISATTATYPSLTELAYLKGVTSAIQTQFSNTQPLATNLTSIGALANATGFLHNNGSGTFTYASAGTGTVTSVSVASANGFTGTVANATTTPAITIIAGAITPTSVNSVVISGTSTPTLAVTGTTTVSGSNTGDVTLTTTGTSGAATLTGQVLNIPQYAGTTYTAGTGLTLTTGAFSVNTSQNITTLSNLTSNGIVTTSGGVGTLGVTATTGSGNVVLATSPTLVTPALGTPASGVVTNLTGTAGINITGTAPAGSLTGTTLNSTVVTSSLTSVGTIATGVWQGTAIAPAYMTTMTATVGGTVPTPPNNTTTFLRGDGTFATPASGTGTVTTVSVTTANGVSGTVANATTTPAITLTLGAITPTTVNGLTLSLGYGSNTNNVAIGGNSLLSSSLTGSYNVAISTALRNNTSGFSNTAVGFASMVTNTTGSSNVAIGNAALNNNSVGSGNIAIGYYAGQWETGSNAFYVNNVTQSSLANDKAYSLLYGQFSGTAGSLTGQQLTVNGTLNVNGVIASPTLTTPALGTPASGVMTNVTGTATSLTSGITNALASATTTVNVSSATAPSSGQVLTATGSTTATWQSPSGGGTPTMKVASIFETLARFENNSSGGTITFGNDGASLDTTSTSNRYCNLQLFLSTQNTLYLGSPIFSTKVYVGGIAASAASWYFGIGTPTVSGSGHTYTDAHIGFKIVETGGVASLYATQANGTTENSSSALATISAVTDIDLVLRVNGTSSVDYWYRINGGTQGTVNLTSDMPSTSTSGTKLQWSVSNNNLSSDAYVDINSFSYER